MRRGSTLLSLSFDDLHVPEKLVGNFHLHTTEVGNQMCTVSVASDVALGTPSSVFATKGKHVAAMAAPVGADVCDRLEAMRDTMIDLVFVLPSSSFRYTLCDHLLVALLMASVPTVFALVASSVEEEITAERAFHELVELLLNKLVSIHLVDIPFTHTKSTLTTKTSERCVERTFPHILLDKVQR